MKLTDQQWLELSRLLDEVLALPAAEREAWLKTLPPSADGLGPTLREILSHETAGGTNAFLQTLPKLGPPLASIDRVRLREGAIVGPYRLLRQLGRGGMGSVWLAQRTDGVLKRAVALKLPHAGVYGTQLAERFARERDILAALSHPHIARLYDAGVADDGQLFLALEYVDGEPLAGYCDARRLDLRQRLVLYLQVLDAVQYAHARLVVHRDLKPSNILVENDKVHLLDFGIAKLVADEPAPESDLTQAVGHVLTPDYASPEQIAGAPLTTATDIYSLGVILYELCTGERPYRLKRDSRGALEDAILEAEIVRPSGACRNPERAGLRGLSIRKLQKNLRGDLDTIILKALKRSPADRYSSVTAFADDLQRYVAHEPVRARPDSFGYRTAKFVRRNRLAVSLSALALLVLIGGLGGTVTQAEHAMRQAAIAEEQRDRADHQARTATEQRDFALRQLSRAEAANDFNAFLLSDAAPSGKPFTAGQLLSRAEAIVDRQQAESNANDADILVTIGRQYRNMDQDAKARRVLGRAYAIARTLRDPTTLAHAACNLAAQFGQAGDRDRAEALFQEGLQQLPNEPQYIPDRIGCLIDGGTVARLRYDAGPAVARAREAQALLPQLPYPSPLVNMQVSMELAEAYRVAAEYPAALDTFALAYTSLVALGRENTETAGTLYHNWALTLDLTGQTLQAEEFYRRAMRISSADGTDKNVSPMLLTNLAWSLIDLDRFAEARRYAERAYERAHAEGDEIIIRDSMIVRAKAYRRLGDYAQAEKLLKDVEPRFRATRPPECGCFATIASERAAIAEAHGDAEAALAELDKAVSIAESDPLRGDALAWALLRRSELKLGLGRVDEAHADATKSLRVGMAMAVRGAPSSYVGRARLAEGRAQAALGNPEEAQRAFSSALAELRPTLGADHPQTKLAERLLTSAAARAERAR
jgi:serine/threonine-protein kinase